MSLSGRVDVGNQIQPEGFRRTQALLESTVRHNAMAVIHGPAGRGKTVAARHFVEQRLEMEWVFITTPVGVTVPRLARLLLSSLTGRQPTGSTWDIRCEIDEELARRRGDLVLCIDECQMFPRVDEFEFIRGYHMQHEIPVLFVGGPEAWRVVSRHPMFTSRVLHEYAFPKMSGDEFLKLARAYHDMYREASDSLLMLIYQRTGGNFRNIAKLTLVVQDVLEGSKESVLSVTTVKAALTRMGKNTYDVR